MRYKYIYATIFKSDLEKGRFEVLENLEALDKDGYRFVTKLFSSETKVYLLFRKKDKL